MNADPLATSRAFGRLLRGARETTGLSIRAAARGAGISEGLWRQLEKGQRGVGGGVVLPTNPRASTVRAAARAVDLDLIRALEAAGHHGDAEEERRAQADAAHVLELASRDPTRPVAPEHDDEPFVADAGGEPGMQRVTNEDLYRELRALRQENKELRKDIDELKRDRP